VSEPTFWIPAIKTAEDGFSHPTMIKSTNAGFVAFKDYLNLQSENEELKRDLRQQIELNALAQIGFKMYQDNVDSGGLHKDRKDAIQRYEKEVSNLKKQVERLTNAGDHLWAFAHNCVVLGVYPKTAQEKINIWNAAKEVQS